MSPLSQLIVLLVILLLAWTVGMVGLARGRYKIHAPATTGHPEFERVYRVQMNTLEQVVLFLPTFVLATQSGFELVAVGLGLLWLTGRVWYALAYRRAAEKRAAGFAIGMLAQFGVLLLAGWSVTRGLLGQ